MTLGVEEEFQVIDLATGSLVPRADVLVPAAAEHLGNEVTHELNLCQIETGTPVCDDLEDLRRNLTSSRAALAAAGERLGLGVAAAGTHPFSLWEHQVIDRRTGRFRRMEERYQIVAREQVICGCHVHVGFDDRDLAVTTMCRVRKWLPVLLALTANSPFWQGGDTGYDSYRLQVWQRWPTSGMPPRLGSAVEFDQLVEHLQAIEAIEDASFLYWYARPSSRHPTLELRPSDTCLTVDDAVTAAGLIRALAWTCARETSDADDTRPEVLDAAMWRAARYGLGDRLLSPRSEALLPATDVLRELVDFVAPGLEAHGDTEQVGEGVARIIRIGNGAARQRAAFRARGDGADVVDLLLEATAGVSSTERDHMPRVG